MPKYASFDHTQPEPQLVTGWYDADAIDYPNLPDAADLFEMTQEQWDARSLNPSAIQGGEIVVLPPPPPDPAQVAADEFFNRRAAGLDVTSTASPALNATYSLLADDVALVGSIARDAASGLGLPHDASTVPVKDINGLPHDFPEADIIELYKAERDMTALLAAQRDVMASGGTPEWPPQTATIP